MGTIFEVGCHDRAKVWVDLVVEIIRDLSPDLDAVDFDDRFLCQFPVLSSGRIKIYV